MPVKNQLGTAALQRNIRIIHALAFFHMFMLIVPVIVPFFESKGLSLSEIFYLQAVYAGFIVVLEAPSGMLADRFGRRTVLLIGSIAHGLGYGWLVFADSFAQLLVFECLLGCCMTPRGPCRSPSTLTQAASRICHPPRRLPKGRGHWRGARWP